MNVYICWLALIASLFFNAPLRAQTEELPAQGTTRAETPPFQADYSRYGKTLTVGSRPALTLDSQLATDFSSRLVISAIQEGLYGYDDAQKAVSLLAAGPPQMADELTYYIPLRQGVLFHDGSEFNAQAVVYTVERLLDAATGAPLRDYVSRRIKAVSEEDSFTVKVELANPYVNLPDLFSRVELYPLSPKTVEEYGKDYGQVTAVGTGPFVFSAWKRRELILLRRFNNYWRSDPHLQKQWEDYLAALSPQKENEERTAPLNGTPVDSNAPPPDREEEQSNGEGLQAPPESQHLLPYLNILQFKFYDSADMALMELQNRRISVVADIKGKDLQGLSSRYTTILARPSLRLNQIYLNLDEAPFNDKRVRLALAYALDRAACAEEVYGAYAAPAYSCFPAHYWAHDPLYQGVRHNPDKALSLLRETGHSEANPLRFELLCGDEPHLTAQAKAVAGQWRELGIEAKATPLPKGELLARVYGENGRARTFSAALEDWRGSPDPDSLSYLLYSAASPYNKSHFSDPVLEMLFYHSRSSFSREEKTIFYRQAERLITDEASTVYLSFPDNLWVYNNYVRDLELGCGGFADFARAWIR